MGAFAKWVMTLGLILGAVFFFWPSGERPPEAAPPSRETPKSTSLSRGASRPTNVGVPVPREGIERVQRSEASETGKGPAFEVGQVAHWEDVPTLTRPEPSPSWPGWRCADLETSEAKSLWINDSAEGGGGEIYEGSCAEWVSRGPLVNNKFEQYVDPER